MLRKLIFIPLLSCFFNCYPYQKKTLKLEEIVTLFDSLYQAKKLKSLQLYNTKTLKAANTKDSLLLLKIYKTKASSYYDTKEILNAINYYNKAILLTPKNNKGLLLKGELLYAKAYAEYDLEEYVTSYKTIKKAEEILSKLPHQNKNLLLDIYTDLGSDASYLGFYNDAEFYLQKGLTHYQNHVKELKNNSKNQASKMVLFLYKFIYLYHLQGDETNLLYYFDEFKNYKSNHSLNETEQLMYAASLNCVGDFYLNFRKKFIEKDALRKGIDHIEKALMALNKNKYPANYIQFLFNKTKYYRYSNQFDKALQLNKKLIDLAGKNDERIPFFIAQKGLIYLNNHQKEMAMEQFFEMAKLIHAGTKTLKKDFSNFTPSNTLNHTGLLVEIADEVFEQYPKDSLLKKQLHLFYKAGLQQFKNCYQFSNFNQKLKDYYHIAIHGIIKTSDKKIGINTLQNIINNIENIENKFAWKEFQQNRILVDSNIPDSIFYKEKNIRNQLITARETNNKQEIDKLNNQLEKYEAELKESYPNIANYFLKTFEIADFQKTLSKDAIVIKYKKIEDILYIFTITSNDIKVYTKTIDANYTNLITNYINLLKNKEENTVLAAKICENLIPFSLNKYSNITILPDDKLHHLPFETLVKNKSYLVFNYKINYASHLVFLNKKNDANPKHTLTIFSPTYSDLLNESTRNKTQKLDGAQQEALELSNIFSSQYFNNQKATKENFLVNAKHSTILHLAMHAQLNNEKPELSYFLFAKNKKLYLEELYGLHSRADLAVLSACNTGTSILENNLAATSLQRAFTLAGVKSTAASLWEIPDETTKEIMVSFYKNLKKGFSKSEALQKAKVDYLTSTSDINLKAPYYWAGFVISGDDTPIAKTADIKLIFWLGIAIILLLILALLLKRFQNR